MEGVHDHLKSTTIECPHCAHHMHLELDFSNGDQDFFEECPNCCRDVHIKLHQDDLHRTLDVNIVSDDEQIY